MRLWSIHPKYLDAKGLVALWREALLAQSVLRRRSGGYTNHPQLMRFRKHPSPLEAISNYLAGVWEESELRGYRFDRTKIEHAGPVNGIAVSEGQLRYEFRWLKAKLRQRDPTKFRELLTVQRIECHPLFRAVEGEKEAWEKGKN